MFFASKRIDRLFRAFLEQQRARLTLIPGRDEKLLTLEAKTVRGKTRPLSMKLSDNDFMLAAAPMQQACMTDELHASLLLMDLFEYPSYTLALAPRDHFVLKASCRTSSLNNTAIWLDLTLRLADGAERIENLLQQGTMFESNWRYRALFELEKLHYAPAAE
jgi:hypothetical protein